MDANYYLTSPMLISCINGIDLPTNNQMNAWFQNGYTGTNGYHYENFKKAHYNYCLSKACENGYYNHVVRLIGIGADDFDMGLYFSYRNGHNEIYNLMRQHGGNDLIFGAGLIRRN
jgi:hypothetical protein